LVTQYAFTAIRDRFLASLEMTIEQGIKSGGKPGRFD